MHISIIVPTLNEAARIEGCLARLKQHRVDEIIVVDGHSEDATLELAHDFCARYHATMRAISSARGRALQMNTGAHQARGDVLWFVHADLELPLDAVFWLRRILSDGSCIAGAFKTHTIVDPESARLRRSRTAPWLRLADIRSRYARLPYGDQALFVRRSAFERVGGFPPLPLMEDLEISRRLAKIGRIARADAEVRVSGRRFLQRPIRDTLLVNIFPLLYRCGVPPERLAAIYRHAR